MLDYAQVIAKSQAITATPAYTSQAAVLLPLLRQQQQLHLLLQVRSAHLRWQPGDICFPGGKLEAQDHSPQAAALRETTEELGITADHISIYGQMPPCFTHFGLLVHPVIGEINDLIQLNINPTEVAEVFTIPLDWLLKHPPQRATVEIATRLGDDFPEPLRQHDHTGWQKRSQHHVYIYQYQAHIIWGLTAQIIYRYLQYLQ